jgi:hypothetical protein
MRVVILILATALFVLSGTPLLAQRDYPATATIRGENIWLRIDPAEDTEVLDYLQRGDPIRVTGDAVPADGDAFYPVEVVETGETGWVRDLAVDPRSFTAVTELPVVVVDDPPTEESTRRDARPRGNQGTGERSRAETVVVDEPPAEEEPAPRERRTNRPAGGNRESTVGLSFSGSGVDVTEEFTLESGRYRVIGSVQPDETGNFVVDLIGPGDFEEMLFNEIPEAGIRWEGETSVRITEPGEYAIQVDLAESGPWTFQIEPM